jgi:hypothetical protein
MRYFLTIIVVSVVLVVVACETTPGVSKVTTAQDETVYHDPSSTSVTLLSEDNCMVTLTIDTTGNAEYRAWVAGVFERKGDTLFIDFPDDSTKAFTQLDCKYFFSDSLDGRPNLQFKSDLPALFKKHLRFDCDSCGEMILYYGKTKAVLEGNVIRFL